MLKLHLIDLFMLYGQLCNNNKSNRWNLGLSLSQGRQSLWDRGDNIYEGVTSMEMSPQYFRSDFIQ